MKLNFKKLHPEAQVPKQSHKGDAGWDLACIEDFVLLPKTGYLAGTGLAIKIPEGYVGDIRPRSGFSTKNRVIILNSPGTCDASYIGEYKISLFNIGDEIVKVEKGTRIAQLVVHKVEELEFEEVGSFEETNRNSNGFGSTGK